MKRSVKAGMLMLMVALAGAGNWLPVFRDRIQSLFDLSNTQLGLLLSIGQVVGVGGALACGPIMARIGSSRMLLVCFWGCFSGLMLLAVPGSWLFFIAALSLLAFFFAPLNIAAQAYLSELFPDRRRRILSLFFVVYSVVGMLYPVLAESLLATAGFKDDAVFRRLLHGMFGALACILVVGIAAALRHMRAEVRDSSSQASFSQATLSAGAITFLTILLIMHGTADTALAIWMPRVLGSQCYARQYVLPGFVVSSYSFAYVVSRLLLSIMPEDRWRKRLMVAPGLSGGLIMLFGILSRNQAVTAVCYVAGAFMWSVECPVFIAVLTGAGRRFGNAMALFSAISGVTTFVLGICLGALGDHIGESQLWKILLIPAAIFPLVGLGGLYWVAVYGRRYLGSMSAEMNMSSATVLKE